ncbi:heavy-metal-associated domain-containing protein [Erysipelothrix tonsillarum]|uniref:heavy-metal-associated domain-containing protein n=1 Tax=Erysipelothrix tonsillarum TaxID=38402 RepID=UPI00037C4078|nr:heavy metal-associated domain-containing protein [Erysipelothrix tonsillarum]
MEKKIRLETLTCPSCVTKIEKGVSQLKGVNRVDVGFNTSTVRVSYDEAKVDANSIKKRIEELGFALR